MAIYIRTVGLTVNVTTDWDVRAAAGVLTLAVTRPDGDTLRWALTIVNGWNGTTGTAYCVTAPGELELAGSYTLQGEWVPAGTTQRFMTNKVTMTVSA